MEAIRICKDRNVLSEYLSSKESEVVSIMMVLYDEEEIMRSYVESERHDAQQEARYGEKIDTAKRLLQMKKFSYDDILSALDLQLRKLENWQVNYRFCR